VGAEIGVPKLFRKGAKIPYGVAISCGALLIGLDLPYLWTNI
jgi:Flp pilus assembly protein protease CpaA